MSVIDSIPHDILKVKDWFHHEKISVLPDWLREKHPDLKKAIKVHHEKWESDKIASCVARLRLKYSYWGWRGEGENIPPFLIKTYGDIITWDKERREELWDEILNKYQEFNPKEADREVNELVSDFPQDSRFPLVSLKTHHWITWALHEQGEGEKEEIYILKSSIPLTEFHKLEDIRRFFNNRERYMVLILKTLGGYYPIRVGDEVLLILSSSGLKESAMADFKRMNIPLDIQIFNYKIGKKNYKMKQGLRELRYVKSWDSEYFSMGASEDYGFSTGKAEWAEFLDSRYGYVAWIELKPISELERSSEGFLRFAEDKLERMPRDKQTEEEKPEVPICPELLVSVASDYMEFVSEFAREINRRVNPKRFKITEAFDKSLFLYGIKEVSDAIPLYLRLRKKANSLHIPVSVSIVVTKPKHPFWHVLNMFGENKLIFMEGGKVVEISDEEAKLIDEVTGYIEDVTRGMFHNEILMKSKRKGKEALKLHIKGLGAEGKISGKARDKLCWLIEEIAKRHVEEGERRIVTYRALNALEPFTSSRG
jgi:hypothetical protein